MRLIPPFLALPTLLSCASGPTPTAPDLKGREGACVVVCLSRRLAVWAELRGTPSSRVEGWPAGQKPSLVVFPRRGFNPALIGDGGASLVWIESERVVEVVADSRGLGRVATPSREVTAVLVLPPLADLQGLQPGDRVRIVQEAPV